MMNDFHFDLESLSELGDALELHLPKDDLQLSLGLGEVKPFAGGCQSSSLASQLNTFQHQDSIDLTSDMSLFFAMNDIPEVSNTAVAPEVTTDNLQTVMEECGITIPEEDYKMETTQSLIEEVESYLQAAEGTGTVVDDSAPVTVPGNTVYMDDTPVVIEEMYLPVKQTEVGIPVKQTKTTLQPRPDNSFVQHLSTQQVASSSPNQVLDALVTGNISLDDSGMVLTEADLSNAVMTNVTTEDGEQVIIIIAPPSPTSRIGSVSPAHSSVSDTSFTVPEGSPIPSISPGPSSDYDSSYDTDPDFSPASLKTIRRTSDFNPQFLQNTPENNKPRKKYQRTKKPQPPTGPYPTDKKERKKAQNRTAAFRYREKKKEEQDQADGEIDALVRKNTALKTSLGDIENELRILKKLMTEAGLGKYARAAKM